MDLTDFELANLPRARTLPARWYLDPAFLDLEKEKIFSRCWQPVGRSQELVKEGDYLTTEILEEPIVVVRGGDDKLRAFSNVCRHRAGPVAVGTGNRRSFQCQYHGWTYHLDGRLLRAPEFEGVEDFSPAEICLPPFAAEAWGPLVFVNFHPEPQPIAECLADIHLAVSERGLAFDRLELYERREYSVRCNWKIYVDNFLEGYHIPIAHPALFREVDYDRYRVDTFRYHSSQYAPMRPDPDARVSSRVYREDEPGPLYYWVFPNLMLNFYPGNLQVNHVVPVSQDETLTVFEWLALPGVDEEDLKKSMKFSDQVQKEDIYLCESVQRGLKSRTYQEGRLSVRRENGVHHFQRLVHEFLTR